MLFVNNGKNIKKHNIALKLTEGAASHKFGQGKVLRIKICSGIFCRSSVKHNFHILNSYKAA